MKTTTPNLGTKIKHLRKERDLSLSALSTQTGITIATLSRFENNLTSLNLDRLSRIAAALEVDIASILSSDTPGNIPEGSKREKSSPVTARRSIARASDIKLHDIPGARLMHLCSDLKNRLMFPLYLEITCKSIEEHGDLLRHAGEEYIYVLSGTLELHTEHYEPVTLETNDSMYIDSTMGHAYVSIGTEPARVISVVACPDSHFQKAFQAASEKQGGPAINELRLMGIATPEDEKLYAPVPPRKVRPKKAAS